MTTRHNFAQPSFTAMIVLLLLIASFFTTFPVSAISGAVISFTGDGSTLGSNCTDTSLIFMLAFTGTTNDSNGNDYLALMQLDGNGTVQSNVFLTIAVGQSAGELATTTSLGRINGATVDARPIYLRLIDIGYPGGISPISPEGIAISQAGTVKASDSFDPALINPACATLPYIGDEPLFNDGRINKEAQATVVAYCNSPQTGDIEVYAIHQSKGYFAFTATKEEIAAIPAKPAVNTLIEQALGAQLWRLTNGNLEIRRGADDNKVYAYQWSGC